jgi:hypothetical protein
MLRFASHPRSSGVRFAGTKKGSSAPLSFWKRGAIQVGIGFSLGFAVQAFAVKTRLYDAVGEGKMRRRIAIDEGVLDLRGDIAKWQAEDMKIAAARAASKPA